MQVIKKLQDHAKWVVEDALEKWLCALRGQQAPAKVVLTRIIIVREQEGVHVQSAAFPRRYR
jgi:hypothetical protein